MIKMFCHYKETQQVSYDDFDTHVWTLPIGLETTIKDLLDFKHHCRLKINRLAEYPIALEGIFFSSEVADD